MASNTASLPPYIPGSIQWFICILEQLATSEDHCEYATGIKGIHWMNAELFEEKPQCNISPLLKHLFDEWTKLQPCYFEPC